MNIRSYLDNMGVPYTWSHHDPTYTAQNLAMKEHVSGKKVVKPVVVEADGHFVLCALPASYYVDIDQLKKELNAQEAKLAAEQQFGPIFADCELGAEPPIGKLFGLPTVMDESLMQEDEVVFQAGTHEDAIIMKRDDFVRATQPIILQFGRQRA